MLLKKKKFWASISLVVLISLSAISYGEGIKVENKIKNIELKLDGATNITFETSEDNFEVKEVKYKGIRHNPISIITKSDRIILEQKKEVNDDFSITYKLIVPKGKNLQINSGLLTMSGEMDAKKLVISSGLLTANMNLRIEAMTKISTGSGNFNMTFKKSGGVDVSAGSATGNIWVPKGTKVSSSIPWQGLQINEFSE